MKQIIRLTESDLHKIVKESVRNVIREMEGAPGGGGANNAAGVYGGAEGQAKNLIDASPFKTDGKFLGDTIKRNEDEENGSISMKRESKLHRLVNKSVNRVLTETTDSSSSGDVNRPVLPIMKRPSIVGEPIDKKVDKLRDDASDRNGGNNHSVAVNHIGESVIREAVEESIGNWLKTAALGTMMAASPLQANAQMPNYNQTGVEQQAPMSKENVKQILQTWNKMSPLPSITKQEAQNKIFNNFTMSEYNKIGAITKLFDAILIKSQDGKFLTGDNFSLNDIQTIYKKYGKNVAIMQIDGVKYFVNMDAMADYTW